MNRKDAKDAKEEGEEGDRVLHKTNFYSLSSSISCQIRKQTSRTIPNGLLISPIVVAITNRTMLRRCFGESFILIQPVFIGVECKVFLGL